VTYLTNGPQFKREKVEQLRISPMMSWQLLPPSCAMITRRSGNHHGCHKRLWVQGRLDVTLRRMDKWHTDPGHEGASPGEADTGRWLHIDRQPDRFGAGTSRDGRPYSTRLDLEASDR
jgi:hypothetical protein